MRRWLLCEVALVIGVRLNMDMLLGHCLASSDPGHEQGHVFPDGQQRKRNSEFPSIRANSFSYAAGLGGGVKAACRRKAVANCVFDPAAQTRYGLVEGAFRDSAMVLRNICADIQELPQTD